MPAARALPIAVTVLVLGVALPGGAALAVGEPGAATYSQDAGEPDGNVTVLRGAGYLFDTLDDTADLRRARSAGRLRPATHLVPGDLLVLRLRSTRVSELLGEREGTRTARFFRVLNTTAVDVSVVDGASLPDRISAKLQLNRSNVAVLHDPANATVALLVDTENATLVGRTSGEPVQRPLDDFGGFEAVVEIPTDGGDRRVLVGSSRFFGPYATIHSPDAGVHLQQFPATVRQNATDTLALNVTTSLLPGTNVTVKAVAPDGAVLAARRVRTRQPRGTTERFGDSVVQTTLAVGGLDASAAVDLVVATTEPIDRERVVVGPPPRMWNTTAELVTAGEHRGQVEVSATLELPADGFFVVHGDGESRTTPVPGDTRVRATIYVDRSAISDGHGTVYSYAAWDADRDGIYGPPSDWMFGTVAHVGASAQDDELDAYVPVEGWTEGTPPPLSPTPPTPPPTTTPGVGLLGAVVAVTSAVLLRTRRR